MATEKNEPRLPGERPSDVKAGTVAGTGAAAGTGPGAETTPSGAYRKSFQDPGDARGLPPPPRYRFHGGERVRLTRAQTYADRRVEAGAEGIALYPSSQAASWVVHYPVEGVRVVPEWDLEMLSPSPAAH